MGRKRTREYWRKKAATVAKKIARTKANFKCAYCGQGEPQRRTHGSHIWAEGKYKNMSADVDNILCLCAGHHAVMPGRNPGEWNWHAYPMTSTKWFNENYPELAKKLQKRTQTSLRANINFEEKYKELRAQLKELEQANES